MKLFSHKKRAVDLGPYPLELLPHVEDSLATPPGFAGTVPPRPTESRRAGRHCVGPAMQIYEDLLDEDRRGDVSPQAPIPEDPGAVAEHLKAGLYFLDADMVGTGRIPDDAWIDFARDAGRGDHRDAHKYCVVVLVQFSRDLGADQPGEQWIAGSRQRAANLRASELAVITAGYIRRLGFDAVAHTATASDLNLDRLALQCGLVEIRRGKLRAPFLKGGYALAAVSTGLDMATDGPLAERSALDELSSTRSPKWFMGRGGTRAGIDRLNGDHRPLHMGRYPMERIRRVDEPTTLILRDEVKRVPVRGGGFPRAAAGDMGPKFAEDVKVFAYKTPQAQSYISQIRTMQPHQDGESTAQVAVGTDDPATNADDLKALSYHLGGDLVGVCDVPEYAWYSHDKLGEVIEPDHSSAIVILLDQGYETMEAASGDDWVSGAQSMRAYMRGAQIAGIVAEHIRSLGYSARSQTNIYSEVLHIPLVLEAGLGELSRIGEVVLNPFIGPRFKSVVVTTDMPIAPDKAVDFGLQDFCNKCTKCARECPCGAIPFGDKIMFNGAEMWKPDVEKCTKYRLGNLKGAACGRCMKTCPYNIEGVLSERAGLWAAINLPFARKWIAELDDKLGNGSINPIKKWWWDLEWRDGEASEPRHGTNARDLDLEGGRIADKQKIALYPPEFLPPGDDMGTPVKLIRKEAVERGLNAELPATARKRKPMPR